MAAILRTGDFVASLGVNTDVGEGAPGIGYLNANTVLSQLRFLGIDHIRELLPGSVSAQQVAVCDQLASAGIKLDVLIPGNGAVDLKADMALLDAFETKHPGAIASIEGPNEVDIWPITYAGKTGVAAAIAFQRDLYHAVHADPLLQGIPVYNFTLGAVLPADAGIGNMSASADAANVHAYAPDGIRPSWVVPAAIQGFAADAPNKPTVVTETNYYTLPQDSNWGGVNEAVQAVYGLDTALDDFKNGVSFTYFYELEDSGTSANREQHFGLFRFDGTPKPFATALHDLTTLLADTGAAAQSFTPGPLAYSIANLPWTASTMALQKSSGVYDIAVWDEQALWDPTAHRQLAATTSQITLHLGQTAASVSVFDPVKGTTAIATYKNIQDVTLSLSSDPLLIEVTPSSLSGNITLAPPAIATITGKSGGAVTLSGTAAAGSTVTVSDTAKGATSTIGTATAGANGAWSLTTHAKVDTSTINAYRATATDALGHSAAMAGSFILASTGHDVITSAPGVSNVFAVMSFRGSDVIDAFKSTQSAGASHDVIDFSGRGLTSFAQVRALTTGSASAVITIAAGKTITLTGVAPTSLTATDFRFS